MENIAREIKAWAMKYNFYCKERNAVREFGDCDHAEVWDMVKAETERIEDEMYKVMDNIYRLEAASGNRFWHRLSNDGITLALGCYEEA